MKKRVAIPTILVVITIISCLFSAGCERNKLLTFTPMIIKVGLPTPLNDATAPWGEFNIEPYETWIDLFNRKGFKVAGQRYNFKLIMADDRNSPEGGEEAARKLVYDEGCKFIAGHWSWSYDTISAITNREKVIFITRTGAGIDYDPETQPYNVFGSPSKEVWIGNLLAAHEAFPDRKIGLLEPTSGLKPSEMDDISKRYLDPVGMDYQWEIYPEGTNDFTPYIAKFAEGDCTLIYTDTGLSSLVPLARQRWEAGYNWPIGQAGGLAKMDLYMDACGYEAAQGIIGSYFGIWDFKKTKVKPEYVAMCQEVMNTLSNRYGEEYTYNDWIGWLPSHLLLLSQAMQKSRSVDDTDAIMKAIRGGTFSTTAGKFKMTGKETYGSPIVFGTPGAICIINGSRATYLSEHRIDSIP
jgi:ABC-type branched-subunit amino acid transport system substrate-binding protein